MPLTKYDHMIKALASYRGDHSASPFCHGDRGAVGLSRKCLAVDAGAIPHDTILGARTPAAGREVRAGH
jgi:hypothetical protein